MKEQKLCRFFLVLFSSYHVKNIHGLCTGLYISVYSQDCSQTCMPIAFQVTICSQFPSKSYCKLFKNMQKKRGYITVAQSYKDFNLKEQPNNKGTLFKLRLQPNFFRLNGNWTLLHGAKRENLTQCIFLPHHSGLHVLLQERIY